MTQNDNPQHEGAERSSVKFERSAKGVIQPSVRIVAGDDDKVALDHLLSEAARIFAEALEFAKRAGEKP